MPKTAKRIIILLGVPGSGKGTQASKIAERYHFAHLSTGELLRALERDPDGDPADKELVSSMRVGKLVPDSLIYKLAFNAIASELQAGRGVVLDGAIRTLEQAKNFQEFFTKKGIIGQVIVIELALSDEESRERLQYRLTHAAEKRADDNPQVIGRRLMEQGNSALRPIAEYYRGLGLLKQVAGGEPVETVTKNIQEIIE